MTLIEIMVCVTLSCVLVAMGVSLWAFGSRSFAAMSNYTDLDSKSRTALDLMSRDIRAATQVIAFQNSATVKSFTITNTTLGTGATYLWRASTGSLVCQRSGQADKVYLTGCIAWDAQPFQRTPQTNGNYVFMPATNSAGAVDLTICKLINMTWRCSRTLFGNQLDTESVRTAQLVLRNKQ
jgi:hypothetical protein